MRKAVDPSEALRSEIRAFLGFRLEQATLAPELESVSNEPAFTRKTIAYRRVDRETIRAFLFEPKVAKSEAVVVALHQHNSEWALVSARPRRATHDEAPQRGVTRRDGRARAHENRTSRTRGPFVRRQYRAVYGSDGYAHSVHVCERRRMFLPPQIGSRHRARNGTPSTRRATLPSSSGCARTPDE